MHFEVLVEDRSGLVVVEAVLEKLLGPANEPHSRRLIPYKGLGHLPKGLKAGHAAGKRLLINRLPELLRGYGRSLPKGSAVLVIVDLDDADCQTLKSQLLAVAHVCKPCPPVLFRIAIEEIEAWLLGDPTAVRKAYELNPRAGPLLESYEPDAIVGTWEKLADVVFPGGSAKLKGLGYPQIGQFKSQWAERIAPAIDLDRHNSPSLKAFCTGVRRLIAGGPASWPVV